MRCVVLLALLVLLAAGCTDPNPNYIPPGLRSSYDYDAGHLVFPGPPDMAAPVDFEVPPDLRPVVDLTVIPDLFSCVGNKTHEGAFCCVGPRGATCSKDSDCCGVYEDGGATICEFIDNNRGNRCCTWIQGTSGYSCASPKK